MGRGKRCDGAVVIRGRVPRGVPPDDLAVGGDERGRF